MRHHLLEQLGVTLLKRIGLARRERPAQLTRDGAGEQPSAHADAAMYAPAVDRHLGLGQRLLPGEDVRVDGIHQRPVEIEDERAHNRHDTSPRRLPAWVLGRNRACRTVKRLSRQIGTT